MSKKNEDSGKRKKSLRDVLTGKNDLKERAHAVVNVQKELSRLEVMLEELKVEYEKYFLGLLDRKPNKSHQDVKMQIRKVQRAPFKKTQDTHKQRALETRYHTYNNYWERSYKAKESGTYKRDIFKADLRERRNSEALKAETVKGKASSQMKGLFDNYKMLLEKQTGKKQNIDFEEFKKILSQKANNFKDKNGNTGFTFKLANKNGKIVIQTCKRAPSQKAKKSIAGTSTQKPKKRKINIAAPNLK